MSTTVTIGDTDYTSYVQDGDYAQVAHTIPTSGVNTAYKLSGSSWVSSQPIVITSLRTYLASYDGVGDIVVSVGGFSCTFKNVAINSTPPLTDWTIVSGTYVNGGTSTNFRINPSTGGGFYFKRAPTGTNTVKQDGYEWGGPMYGQYRFIEAPIAPTGFSATPSGAAGLVNFAWTAPSDDGGATISGYNIYRGTSSSSIITLIGSTTSTSWSYTAPDANNYYYTVRAKNSVTTASGTVSAAATYDTAQALFDPDEQKPNSLTATPHETIDGRIDLAWLPPTTPPAATYGYKIYQDTVLIDTISITSDPAESYTVTGLTPGVEYDFYVKTTWSGGDSIASNIATATAPGFATAASALVVSPYEYVEVSPSVTVSVAVAGQLRISWDAVTGMTSTGGYKLYRDDVQIAGSGISGSLIGNMTSPFYIDNGLTPDRLYSYAVRAYLTDPNEVGELTNPATGIPSSTSYQIVTDTVDNLTNAEFSGEFVGAVTVVDAQTFSYSVPGGTNLPLAIITPSLDGAVSSELVDIFAVDKTITKLSDTSFSISASGESDVTTKSITSTATNETNVALNGLHTLPVGTTSGTTITYSVTDPVLSSDITTVSVSGIVSNLDAGDLAQSDATILSVPTASSFTFLKSGVSDFEEAVITGYVTNSANENIYNGPTQAVASVPRYDELTYTVTVADSGPTSESVDIEFPEDAARKTSATGYLNVEYRSGWIG